MSMRGSQTITAFLPYIYNGIDEDRTALNERVAELTAACDVNSDGRINNRDLGLLQRYLNERDVELGH